MSDRKAVEWIESMKRKADIILKMSLRCPTVAVYAALDSQLSLLSFAGVYPNVGDGAGGKVCYEV